MPSAVKAKSRRDRLVVGRLIELLLQLESWVPLAYASVGLAIASLLWALLHLMGHTVFSGSPADALGRASWFGATVNAGLKYAFLPAMVLGLAGALRDPDTRRAGLVGTGLSLLAIVTWAITAAIVKFLNPAGSL